MEYASDHYPIDFFLFPNVQRLSFLAFLSTMSNFFNLELQISNNSQWLFSINRNEILNWWNFDIIGGLIEYRRPSWFIILNQSYFQKIYHLINIEITFQVPVDWAMFSFFYFFIYYLISNYRVIFKSKIV